MQEICIKICPAVEVLPVMEPQIKTKLHKVRMNM